MKRFLILALALTLALSLAACLKQEEKPSGNGTSPPVTQQTTAPGSQQTTPGTQPTTPGTQPTESEPSGGDIGSWLDTKIGQFYSQFTSGKMYMEYESEMEGMLITVISATDGDKVYSSSKIDGQIVGETVIDGEYMYAIDHESQTIIKMHNDEPNDTDTLLEEEELDLDTLVKGTRVIEGKTYYTEEWTMDNDKTTLCFDGDKLAYIFYEYEGMELTIKILKVSAQVDESLFQLPEGYQMITM